MQTELFPTEKYGTSYLKALAEYRSYVSKGVRAHLVWLKEEMRYSISFNSEEFIKNKLSSVYELIK